ncbi:hypothetical protein NKI74_28155 [Mesorhizobium sp. M0494]|uniref:hypothetical protein n=1 Tax=Mesorhizobium sp. M0494 TaxID=2956951 RepID=UPI0033350F52
MKLLSLVVAATFSLAMSAWAEDLPSSAKKASMEEFKTFANGKKVNVIIYDAGAAITATLVWSWKKKQIIGEALVNNKTKIKVKVPLTFDGDKACSQDQGKPVCHLIYIDNDKFYEVRDDGKVHATSTLVQ